MVLRAAEVAGVFEGDPWMPCFKKHLEHLLPKIDGRHFLGGYFALASELLVVEVTLLEFAPIGIVKVGNFIGAEERPVLAGLHTLHEKIGNPVGGIEIVSAPTVVACVAPELQEVLDVIVPSLEIGAA